MKESIKSNLDDPHQLEKLYRSNKVVFKKDFNLIFPDIQDHLAAQI